MPRFIDKKIYIFLFTEGEKNLFAFVYHACHPVSRADGNKASADYIRAMREAVKERFGIEVCLFMQGCAGDIRPNIAEKRIKFLPRFRLNWKFKDPPAKRDEQFVDEQYQEAVLGARESETFEIYPENLFIGQKTIDVDGDGKLDIDVMQIGNIFEFVFLPYEVSHLYHLDIQNRQSLPQKFIVSCSNHTRGYLPHPSQLSSGGYEVDGAIQYTDIENRVCIRDGLV